MCITRDIEICLRPVYYLTVILEDHSRGNSAGWHLKCCLSLYTHTYN